MTASPFDVADELDRLAAEIKSLSMFADRAPTDRGADVTYRQAHEFGRRLARLGFEAYGEPLLRLATARNSWSGRAALLRAAADMARTQAAEIRERARDDERRAADPLLAYVERRLSRVADDHVREMIARAARVSEDDDLRAVDERVEEVEYALALLIGTGRDAIVKDAREALGELARLARGEEA